MSRLLAWNVEPAELQRRQQAEHHLSSRVYEYSYRDKDGGVHYVSTVTTTYVSGSFQAVGGYEIDSPAGIMPPQFPKDRPQEQYIPLILPEGIYRFMKKRTAGERTTIENVFRYAEWGGLLTVGSVRDASPEELGQFGKGSSIFLAEGFGRREENEY